MTKHFGSVPRLRPACVQHVRRLTMTMLRLLLVSFITTASSLRSNVEGNFSAELAQYGERCKGREAKKCDKGLVCSPKTWTCKAALMAPCNGPDLDKMECESAAYDRSIKCGRADRDGISRCCIKGSSPLLPYSQQSNRAPYYQGSGYLGDDRYSYEDCCSGVAQDRVRSDLFTTSSQNFLLCK